jgi:hypothetical protein
MTQKPWWRYVYISMCIAKLISDTQVYLPALEGHVPSEMIHTLHAFIEFCYIIRQDVHDMNTLNELQDALDQFQHYHTIFQTSGVRPNSFNLPHQHLHLHYFKLIWAFGAPNGLCSSITKLKHIATIKEPWRHSSHYNALGQMLLTNQQLNKLAALHADFEACRMLTASINSSGAYFNLNFWSLTNIVICLSTDNTAPPAPAPLPSMAAREDDDDDDDKGTVVGPRIQAHVNLAKTIAHMYTFIFAISITVI